MYEWPRCSMLPNATRDDLAMSGAAHAPCGPDGQSKQALSLAREPHAEKIDPTVLGYDVVHVAVAVNSAIQIDLTGQVDADSIGSQLYSGIGGQGDVGR
jgi:hypothetical protein